jgi:hypothetical protein
MNPTTQPLLGAHVHTYTRTTHVTTHVPHRYPPVLSPVEVVDSKMFLFYCSQIGQCSKHVYHSMYVSCIFYLNFFKSLHKKSVSAFSPSSANRLRPFLTEGCVSKAARRLSYPGAMPVPNVNSATTSE